jgi:HEAT repeat protein
VRGWVRGEPSYAGRPSSVWGKALRDDPSGAAAQLKAGGGAAVPVLLALLEDRRGDWETTHRRWKAAEVLGQLGEEARAATPALLAALHDPDPHVQTVATKALGEIGPAADVVPALTERLGVGDRAATIRALSRFKAEARPAIPALLELLKDPDPRIRWEAARTLGKIGADAAVAVPALVEAFKDPEAPVREHAAEALGDIGPPAKDGVPALIEALRDADMKVRRDAARSLGLIGPAAKTALPALRQLDKDPEREVREAASKSLRQLDPDSAVKKPGS